MPFKTKIIKNLQKNISNYNRSNILDDRNQNQCKIQHTDHDQYLQYKQNEKSASDSKKVIRKIGNVYQNMLMLKPIKQWHIINFFNIIPLNQEALRSGECQESYFRSLFYTKNIKKVVAKPKYIVLHLVDSDLKFPPMQYYINRLMSFGDEKCFNFAKTMQKTAENIKLIQQYQLKKQIKDDDLAENYVKSIADRMFYCRANNKVFLSKSFLELLEYDTQNMALQMLKFRASLYDACSAHSYFDVMRHAIQNLSNLVSLLLDHISLQTFLDNSVVRYRDVLYTKNGKKISVKAKAGMPNPLVNIFEVEQIINIAEQIEDNMFFRSRKRQEFHQARSERKDTEENTLNFILGLNQRQSQKELKVASYIQTTEVQERCKCQE